MSDTSSPGLWIKRRRKALDLTQDELAKRVGCSLETIHKIETDLRRPSRQIAERLAIQLGLFPDEQVTFIQVVRAERSVDRLASPKQNFAHAAFVSTSHSAGSEMSSVLPSGTITFLFTDITSSTYLWEQYGQAMSTALARHDVLLKTIIRAHNGVIFKTVGDGVLAAFAHALDALKAALAAQRAVGTERWTLPEPIRVRMALHSGSAEIRNNDYFGSAVNRTARLLSAGHSGQILLSQATEQLVREHIPPTIKLCDLGTHCLKDLTLPERIFQPIVPDLPKVFPALISQKACRSNLPTQLTSLVGRERDVAAVCSLLLQDNIRLLTLTGPGGSGKTRLALQVAAELVEVFPDGVSFIDLAPIRTSDLVLAAIAHTLGVRETSGQPLAERLKDELRDKQMLLLLDNFEQVLDAAMIIVDLLASAAQLKILVTSRETLHLRGEQEVTVAPLALPDCTALPPLDQLSQYAAVALFIQRAQAIQADFQITTRTAATVAEICVRLDGLPLAIELAAARLKLFPPDALLTRLGSRLTLLTSGARDLPTRQQRMWDTIAWSYDLLTVAEQRLFRQLGVFVGGATLEAIDAVCTAADDLSLDVVEGVAALVDKSLLRQIAGSDGVPRLVMLETIREYALEQLEAHGESALLHRRHARYYLSLGEDGAPGRGPDDGTWARRMDQHYDNLQSALIWSQTPACDPEFALEIACAMEGLWFHRGLLREAGSELERAFNHPLGLESVSVRQRADAHAMAGLFLGLTRQNQAAQTHFEHLLPLAQALGDTAQYAWALTRLGWLACERGASSTAWTLLTESLAIFRELNDNLYTVDTLNTMASVAILEEDPERAEALLAESRALGQGETYDPDMIGFALTHLGHAAQLRGSYDQAVQLHLESLKHFQMLGKHRIGIAWAYHGLGEAALSQGQLEDARRWLIQGVELSRKLDDQACIAWCLAGLGSVAAFISQPEQGACLWGAAERLRHALQARPAPAARATYERALCMARCQLGEQAFAEAWAMGQSMLLEDVLVEARGQSSPVTH